MKTLKIIQEEILIFKEKIMKKKLRRNWKKLEIKDVQLIPKTKKEKWRVVAKFWNPSRPQTEEAGNRVSKI